MAGADKSSPLAQAFAQAKDDSSDAVHFSDFAPYGPSTGAPAAFAARSILDDKGAVIGVLAVQLSDQLLNTAIEANINLGQTGEMLILGSDGRARTTSRFPTASISLTRFRNLQA